MDASSSYAIWHIITAVPPTELQCSRRGYDLLFTYSLGQPDGSCAWLSILSAPYDPAAHGDALFRDFQLFGCYSRGYLTTHFPFSLG